MQDPRNLLWRLRLIQNRQPLPLYVDSGSHDAVGQHDDSARQSNLCPAGPALSFTMHKHSEPLAVNPRRNTRRGKTPSSTASDEDVMGEMKQDSKGAGVAATDATDQPSKTIPLPAAKKKRGRSPNPPPNLRTKQPKEKKAK
ncbi:hypothetical protein WJX77_006391 [Trebouxia sp. C0004]